MKTLLLLLTLSFSPVIAQIVQRDTTTNRSANVQTPQQKAQPKIDTVYIIQQPIYQQPVYQQPAYQQPVYQQPQRVENEYSMSSGTQVLYVVLIGLAMIPLLFLL